MTVIVSPEQADKALAVLKNCGETAYVIGHVQEGEHGVENMLNIAVMVSGGGTNLQAILDAQQAGESWRSGNSGPLFSAWRLCFGKGSECRNRRPCVQPERAGFPGGV